MNCAEMDRIEIRDVKEVADLMEECLKYFLKEDDLSEVGAYGTFKEISDLFAELIRRGHNIDCGVDFDHWGDDGYTKEYVLYINKEGLNVEKAWFEGENFTGYLIGGEVVTAFVFDDCNSRIFRTVESGIIYEVGFIKEKDIQIDKDETGKDKFDKMVDDVFKSGHCHSSDKSKDEKADTVKESKSKKNNDCIDDLIHSLNRDKSISHIGDCKIHRDRDGNVHGFSVEERKGDDHIIYKYYTSESLDEDLIKQFLYHL